ncbi:hypothetical protein K438DRAFT_1751388 [Mycena galopus ATCC 62051]|nr:hypothetical protein K438DRAFT_1751388 [Mycena galopus ATCC 62051]
MKADEGCSKPMARRVGGEEVFAKQVFASLKQCTWRLESDFRRGEKSCASRHPFEWALSGQSCRIKCGKENLKATKTTDFGARSEVDGKMHIRNQGICFAALMRHVVNLKKAISPRGQDLMLEVKHAYAEMACHYFHCIEKRRLVKIEYQLDELIKLVNKVILEY